MSYQVLALKWRPKLFKDAIGQEHITRTLKNSLAANKIGHAYLLTGTRGIGKTTVARIFAKAIRCENLSPEGEPCLTCASCTGIDSGQSLDYLEIDGASNNSVDDVRDLIENVQYLPTSGKYKVYIIDEVHMLSVNAFNALLKTLEEPPEHVIFIFATTDPQKLLGTVLSRCLRFDFKNASEKELVDHLNYIAREEGLSFQTQNIPSELAKQARGSFRDALSLFDQVISLSADKTITEQTLYLSLGMADSQSVINMISAIILKDKNLVQDLFNKVIQDNVDFKNFSMQVLDKLYEIIGNVNENNQVALERLPENILAQVSLTELIWIYESLFRDLDWSLKSLDPQKATAFIFMKTALREMVLSQSNQPLSLKKKVAEQPQEIIEEKVPEIEEKSSSSDIIQEAMKEAAEKELEAPMPELKVEAPISEAADDPIAPIGPKTWDNFLKYLFQTDKVLAINVERGNLINNEDFGSKDKIYEIGFKPDCKIFYDFLNEGQNTAKLKGIIMQYLNLSTEDFQLNVKLLAQDQDFLSSVDIVEKNEADKREELRQNLLNNKYIKTAEQIFNTEVNKVVLNEKE